MAKTVQTICVSLEPKYIDILEKIKKKEKKNMSDVFRFLLTQEQEREVEAEWKRQYEEYYAGKRGVR